MCRSDGENAAGADIGLGDRRQILGREFSILLRKEPASLPQPGSIQRVAQFADERSGAIKLRLEQNELRISSSSTESGESEDTIESPYQFDALVVGFNSAYMLDFLKAIGNTGEVRLEFKDAQSAGQMRPEDAGDEYKYRYIIMPMRI